MTDGNGSPEILDDRPLRLVDVNVRVGALPLLADTTVTMPGGKITVIVGGSGAGKSVLLRVLAGLIPRRGETVTWDGDIELGGVAGEPESKPQSRTPRVGIVFQQFALFDELSPTANVQFGIDHRQGNATTQSAASWLDELGVPANRRVANLSGGQKQRLAIARTLAAEPDIVLYDEPTSGLDAASGRKVAELIRRTQSKHRRTSIVVTHDYETLLPIADAVLLLDSHEKRLVAIDREHWNDIPDRMKPVATGATESPESTKTDWAMEQADAFFSATGSALIAAIRLPWDALPRFPRVVWGLRFFAHYLRLVGGASAWVYLALAGVIVGFTTTYFTFRFLPFRLYTQPLLIDELLSSIGFALYRVLVPVLATILIAARCGAAVAADVGVKQYGGQVDAMRTLGVRPTAYLLACIVLAFMVATPALEWIAFTAARWVSLITFTQSHPSIGPYFWEQHFYRNLDAGDSSLGWFAFSKGWGWVALKNLACGVGTGAIGYYRGASPKFSAGDVSDAITSTVLWTTLYVLVVHFIVALFEF
ncbi:Maltose/maltodextrin import ATP-binding protein MalK [Rubripirellula tenax]|uniref:Maltose/maltodextrin import ATP-binding protein MalK n=1 Tax=Rubripirellula tenax TaxID=2528015 RepID=A0A5C6F697_9BACT|nr:ATP-binding cassette domain-containing protein [Rubripirellula tenax]TWU56512.1 Maltose/maltodextrin import ATP-binding protein MalK [Rubripirellula tenax]